MRRAAEHAQHATCKIRNMTCSMQHATYNLQYAADGVGGLHLRSCSHALGAAQPPTPHSVRHTGRFRERRSATRSMLRCMLHGTKSMYVACCILHAACRTLHVRRSVQHEIYNGRRATYGVQYATSNMQNRCAK
jgi:hypothetical protein